MATNSSTTDKTMNDEPKSIQQIINNAIWFFLWNAYVMAVECNIERQSNNMWCDVGNNFFLKIVWRVFSIFFFRPYCFTSVDTITNYNSLLAWYMLCVVAFLRCVAMWCILGFLLTNIKTNSSIHIFNIDFGMCSAVGRKQFVQKAPPPS